MKHGNNAQHGIASAAANHIIKAASHSVEYGRAVRIKNALGITSRSRCITQRAGRIFVKSFPLDYVFACGNKLLIAVYICFIFWHVGRVAKRDPFFNAWAKF